MNCTRLYWPVLAMPYILKIGDKVNNLYYLTLGLPNQYRWDARHMTKFVKAVNMPMEHFIDDEPISYFIFASSSLPVLNPFVLIFDTVMVSCHILTFFC